MGIVTDRHANKIEVGSLMYLAANEAVHAYGPAILGADLSPADRKQMPPETEFNLFRSVAYYETLRRFESIFHVESKKLPAYGGLWIDAEFLASIRWSVDYAFTPQQASYF